MVDSKRVGPPKNEWRTPPQFLEAVERYFDIKFTLDPCAAPDNHLKIPEFFTAKDNGLSWPWEGVVWVNPPFETKWLWVRQAYLESLDRGADVWVLLENCTDSLDFHSWAPLCEVYLLRGRIAFLGPGLRSFGSGFRGYMLLHFRRGVEPVIRAVDLTR